MINERRMVMALKRKPVTGMKDMMPAEMEVRDYVIGLIKGIYKHLVFLYGNSVCGTYRELMQ